MLDNSHSCQPNACKPSSARTALLQSVFLRSAPSLATCPPDIGREVAFAGRSNAGKSSALNALARQKQLARASKTPGRTQMINFFSAFDARIVDLPGYGYAAVPLAIKERWQQELGKYLSHRQSLVGLILLMDIRHPLQDLDNQMLMWAKAARLPVHILLTKADKLKFGAQKSTLLRVRDTIDGAQLDGSVQLFSAHKGQGLDEVYTLLDNWLFDRQNDE